VLEADLTRQVRVRRAEPILATDRYEAGEKIATRGQAINAKTLRRWRSWKKSWGGSGATATRREPVKTGRRTAAQPVDARWCGGAGGRLVARLAAGRAPARAPKAFGLPARVNAASETRHRAGWRAGLFAQLAQLMTDKLVQKLVSDGAGCWTPQQKAAQEMAELEARLEKIHAPLQDRLEAYEKRIAELEKELADRGEANRVLIEAKISRVRQQWKANAPPLVWRGTEPLRSSLRLRRCHQCLAAPGAIKMLLLCQRNSAGHALARALSHHHKARARQRLLGSHDCFANAKTRSDDNVSFLRARSGGPDSSRGNLSTAFIGLSSRVIKAAP